MAKPTTFTCPSCQAVAQAVKVWEEIAHRDGGGVLVDVALKCANCGHAVGGTMDGNYNLLTY